MLFYPGAPLGEGAARLVLPSAGRSGLKPREKRTSIRGYGFSDDYRYHTTKSRLEGIGRVPTAQGKQGKWQKKVPLRENTGNVVKTQGKHREFCLNTGKTQGILSAQVVNILF